jgi:hypothetical protein
MKYLRWIHIEDAIKYRAYIEDKSVDIIEDEFIGPKNPVIIIEDESADIIEDESIDPKKIVLVITIEDESIVPETHRVILYKSEPIITRRETIQQAEEDKSTVPKKINPLSRRK